MIQNRKEKEKKEEASLDRLKDKLEAIKAIGKDNSTEITITEEEVDTSDREVMLKILAESCGCGGSEEYVDIKRIVPWDSPLHDGDIVTEYDEADEIW